MFSWLPVRQKYWRERGSDKSVCLLIQLLAGTIRVGCLGCLSRFRTSAGLHGGFGLGEVYRLKLRNTSLLRAMRANRRFSSSGVFVWVWD